MQEQPKIYCICYGKSEWFSERLRRPLIKEKKSDEKTLDSPRSFPDNELTFTCFCYDCKIKVFTPNYVYYCPNENCGSNWVRTEYICCDCGRKDMIYDAMYRYWFIDNAPKIPNIFERKPTEETAEKKENEQMQKEDKQIVEIPPLILPPQNISSSASVS
jgi:hypothetical protein